MARAAAGVAVLRLAALGALLAGLAACDRRVDPASYPAVADLRRELAVALRYGGRRVDGRPPAIERSGRPGALGFPLPAPALDYPVSGPSDRGERCAAVAARRGALYLRSGERVVVHAELPPEGALRIGRLSRCAAGGAGLRVVVETDRVGGAEAELAPGVAVGAMRLPRLGGPARVELTALEGVDSGGSEGGLLLEGLALGARGAPAAPAPAWTAPAQPPNVLVYLIDALRRDALGCYGNPRPLTPHLDRLAAEGTLFTDAVAQGPWTRPTVASLFTGLTPAAHGVLLPREALAEEADTLAEHMHAAGYRTIALVTNGNVSGRLGFAQGFERMRHVSRRGVKVELLEWLTATAGDRRPFFAYLHTIEPHGPYQPPEPFRGRFAPGIDPQLGSRPRLRQLKLRRERPSPVTIRNLRALYEAEVAAADAAFGELRAELERRGVWENTVVVVLADHGEEFYEHGRWEHGSTLYDEMLAIPLLVRAPGLGAGRRARRMAQQVDVFPTLMELVGRPAPAGIDGTSLVAALRGVREPLPPPARSYQIYGHDHEAAVTTTDHRLILTRRRDGSRRLRLYDRRRDPGERHDLHRELPITTAYLESVLRWPARSGGALATPAVQLNSEIQEELRALGYL